MLPLQPEFIEIVQDSDGVLPEEIDNICKKRLEDNKPMPKVEISFRTEKYFIS